MIQNSSLISQQYITHFVHNKYKYPPSMQESFYDDLLLPPPSHKSPAKSPNSHHPQAQQQTIKHLEQQINDLLSQNKELRAELAQKEQSNKKIAKESLEVCRNYLKQQKQLRQNSNKENKLNQKVAKYSQKLSQSQQRNQNFPLLMQSNGTYKKSISSKYQTEMQLLKSNQEYVLLKLRQLEKDCVDATQQASTIGKYIMEIRQLLAPPQHPPRAQF